MKQLCNCDYQNGREMVIKIRKISEQNRSVLDNLWSSDQRKESVDVCTQSPLSSTHHQWLHCRKLLPIHQMKKDDSGNGDMLNRRQNGRYQLDSIGVCHPFECSIQVRSSHKLHWNDEDENGNLAMISHFSSSAWMYHVQAFNISIFMQSFSIIFYG